MAFTPCGQFTAIKTPHAIGGDAGFDTLTSDCPCGGMLMSFLFLSHLCSERIVDPLPGAIIAPDTEIVVHTLPFWIFLG